MRFLGQDQTEPQGLEFGGLSSRYSAKLGLMHSQPAPQEVESSGRNEEPGHSGPITLLWDPPLKELVTRSRGYLQAGSKRIRAARVSSLVALAEAQAWSG